MNRTLVKAVSSLLGLLAMLICMGLPASAELRPQSATETQAAPAMPDMPCCPQKGSVSQKSCAQQCPFIAPATFIFDAPMTSPAIPFAVTHMAGTGLTYAPLAPPPR